MVGSQSGERLGLYWKGRPKTLNRVSDDLHDAFDFMPKAVGAQFEFGD